ncbi:unnamed protein product [Nesidiocoris tenuis]|uniref:Uncharacterized protein n=1 Tax=Nesidiocoris tenuis TaxID=355587 RepID=A0A6H5HIH7_9HEMI|nr:unnamed protein product [Nesidiocoris tenuis]
MRFNIGKHSNRRCKPRTTIGHRSRVSNCRAQFELFCHAQLRSTADRSWLVQETGPTAVKTPIYEPFDRAFPNSVILFCALRSERTLFSEFYDPRYERSERSTGSSHFRTHQYKQRKPFEVPTTAAQRSSKPLT